MFFVETEIFYRPPRRIGIALHLAVFLLVLAVGAWSTWRAANAVLGPSFLLYLLPAMAAVALAPGVAYRIFGLFNAGYLISRDGIRLRWGLRLEYIPMDRIIWVRSQREMPQTLPGPVLLWLGAALGLRLVPGLGSVEYFIAQPGELVLLATSRKVYAIAPPDPTEFLQALQHLMELGSLNPLAEESIYPSFILVRLWRSRWARVLLLAGLALNLGLLAWVSFVIPTRGSIWLGFAVSGEPVPPVRLYLLPLLSSFFFLVNALVGLVFFRQAELQSDRSYLRLGVFQQVEEQEQAPSFSTRLVYAMRRDLDLLPGEFLAYLMWGAGVVIPILFYLAVGIILRAGR